MTNERFRLSLLNMTAPRHAVDAVVGFARDTSAVVVDAKNKAVESVTHAAESTKDAIKNITDKTVKVVSDWYNGTADVSIQHDGTMTILVNGVSYEGIVTIPEVLFPDYIVRLCDSIFRFLEDRYTSFGMVSEEQPKFEGGYRKGHWDYRNGIRFWNGEDASYIERAKGEYKMRGHSNRAAEELARLESEMRAITRKIADDPEFKNSYDAYLAIREAKDKLESNWEQVYSGSWEANKGFIESHRHNIWRDKQIGKNVAEAANKALKDAGSLTVAVNSAAAQEKAAEVPSFAKVATIRKMLEKSIKDNVAGYVNFGLKKHGEAMEKYVTEQIKKLDPKVQDRVRDEFKDNFVLALRNAIKAPDGKELFLNGIWQGFWKDVEVQPEIVAPVGSMPLVRRTDTSDDPQKLIGNYDRYTMMLGERDSNIENVGNFITHHDGSIINGKRSWHTKQSFKPQIDALVKGFSTFLEEINTLNKSYSGDVKAEDQFKIVGKVGNPIVVKGNPPNRRNLVEANQRVREYWTKVESSIKEVEEWLGDSEKIIKEFEGPNLPPTWAKVVAGDKSLKEGMSQANVAPVVVKAPEKQEEKTTDRKVWKCPCGYDNFVWRDTCNRPGCVHTRTGKERGVISFQRRVSEKQEGPKLRDQAFEHLAASYERKLEKKVAEKQSQKFEGPTSNGGFTISSVSASIFEAYVGDTCCGSVPFVVIGDRTGLLVNEHNLKFGMKVKIPSHTNPTVPNILSLNQMAYSKVGLDLVLFEQFQMPSGVKPLKVRFISGKSDRQESGVLVGFDPHKKMAFSVIPCHWKCLEVGKVCHDASTTNTSCGMALMDTTGHVIGIHSDGNSGYALLPNSAVTVDEAVFSKK
jgi:hypothetical protein